MMQAVLISCWPLASVLVAVCVCLAAIARFIKPHQRRPILALHADERGSVQSLSFVLTVPVFIMLMMLAVQVTQLMIGEIIVNYAAFAAARSASVWIPARVETPLELANWLNLRQLTGDNVNYNTAMTSPKMVQIHRAAALALLPIAPSRDLGFGDPNDAVTQAIVSAYSAYSSSYQTNSRLPQRLANKWAYALGATTVDVSTYHRQFGTGQSGYQNEPPLWDSNPFSFEDYYQPGVEIGWRDEVTVKVTHNFALLPGPGRLLARSMSGTSANPMQPNRIQQNGNIYYVPLSASATMVSEGEKSLTPFVFTPFWP
jgi:hypothetical protein